MTGESASNIVEHSFNRRQLIGGAGAVAASAGVPAAASATRQRDGKINPLRIGLCTDLSGPYQSVEGPGGVAAIRRAIADIGGHVGNRPVELLLGDHRNDPAAAAALARGWCADGGADVIISGVNSDTSLAITSVAAQAGKAVLVVGAGTSVQTRERAAPGIIQYAYDTVALATVPGKVLTRQDGDRWFYITADYAFGRELEAHGRAAVKAAGGTVVGSVLNPHDADDFTPYVQAALDSGANVLGLANGHAELIKAMAAMKRMGVGDRMKLGGLLTFVGDIHEMGLAEAQGLYLAESWYWTRDEESRRWAGRFEATQKVMPSSLHAADYSAATQYLRAVAATGSSSAEAVVRHLRSTVLDDMYVKGGGIRADGVMLHDIHLLRMKAPARSTSPWDVYDHVATVSGEEAFPHAA
jgi:branched-chain amino acid transport system substrate-binding protein